MQRAKRLTRRTRAKLARSAPAVIEMGINDIRPDGTQYIARWRFETQPAKR
jgi:hypothetical protein